MSITNPMSPAKPSLTLIVAATKSWGIGNKGRLPWPALKQEMAFFARVTKHVPAALVSPDTSLQPQNVVIMGRKTWESIPQKFRPLKGRTNVVISSKGKEGVSGTDGEAVLVVGGLKEALEKLEGAGNDHGSDASSIPPIGRVFVIGGSSVYDEAMKLPNCKNVLLTKVYKEFECDTVFPVDLDGQEAWRRGWTRRDKEKWEEFTEEEMGETDMVFEAGVMYEFCLYQRI